MLKSKNLFYKKFISKSKSESNIIHNYLRVRTNQYFVKIHVWEELKLPSREPDDIVYPSFSPSYEMREYERKIDRMKKEGLEERTLTNIDTDGSRVVIRDLQTKASSTELYGSCGLYHIDRLLKKKDRNKEIWFLELEIHRGYCYRTDCVVPFLHTRERGDNIIFDQRENPIYFENGEFIEYIL